MQNVESMEQFWRWFQSASSQGQIKKQRVYGRAALIDPRGRRRVRSYKVGMLLQGSDGLAFLRKATSGGGILVIALGFLGIFVCGGQYAFVTGDVPFVTTGFLWLLLTFGASWWYRRPMDISDATRLTQAVQDNRSVFIPLSRITEVKKCRPSGWANPDHLRISFHNDNGSVDVLILGDMVAGRVGFDATETLARLESALAGHQDRHGAARATSAT